MKRSTTFAFAGIVSLGAAAGWWMWGRTPVGFVTGMHPIDGHRAVFTMRHNPTSGPSQEWIGVVDADGVVWSRELPDSTYSIYARHGLTVAGDRVTVKVSDTDTYAQVLAFDVRTGDPLWQSARIEFQPSEHEMMLHVVSGERPFDDGRQLLLGDHDRRVARLVARDSHDGSPLWSHDLPRHVVGELLISSSVVAYRDHAGWVLVRRSDGSIARRIDEYAAACIDEQRFVVWGRHALVEVDLASDELTPTERPLPSPGIPLTCGVHREQVVFGVRVHGDDDRTEIVGIDRERASVAWRIDLGPWEPTVAARTRDNVGPEANPLEGTLSDFVPVLLSPRQVKGLKVAMLDLRRHAIAWESPEHDSLLPEIFRGSGDQHFLSDGSRIVAIDGATGEPTAAVKLAHERPRAFHAVEGRLWVYSIEYGAMDQLPWLLLDGRSLEVVARGGDDLVPTDVTADLEGWLHPAS